MQEANAQKKMDTKIKKSVLSKNAQIKMLKMLIALVIGANGANVFPQKTME